MQQRDPCSVLKNSGNCWHSQLLEHETSANTGLKQVLSFCLKEDLLYHLLNKVAFYFALFFFSQMLKRSKGPISSLSLLQHCSSNRNRSCWRPEKRDLKRFRGGKTHWLLQEGFCCCSPKDNCVFTSYFPALCDASLILALKTFGQSLLLVPSSSHSWFQQPSNFLPVLFSFPECPNCCMFLVAIKGQIVKNHRLHPLLFVS